MRNLNAYSECSLEFLDKIVESKRYSQKDPDYKSRLNQLIPNVKILYRNYDTVFFSNNHTSLNPYGYIHQSKVDLIKLYKSNNSILVKLKNSITTVLDNRAMNTCQYCTIAPISSLDHILPKDEFPEFSVNPKNLIPSCSTCNSHKNEYWRVDNNTIFLNLYTDDLPLEQYLFVDIEFIDNNIQPNFKLRNLHGIDKEFFELLNSHYSRLDLFQRFKNESHKIISELTNLLKGCKRSLNKDQIIQIVLDKIEEDKASFGTNYYKSILEFALINSDTFLNNIFSD
ncbi:HNH endonuclease [Empedobacter falsenii]